MSLLMFVCHVLQIAHCLALGIGASMGQKTTPIQACGGLYKLAVKGRVRICVLFFFLFCLKLLSFALADL